MPGRLIVWLQAYKVFEKIKVVHSLIDIADSLQKVWMEPLFHHICHNNIHSKAFDQKIVLQRTLEKLRQRHNPHKIDRK